MLLAQVDQDNHSLEMWIESWNKDRGEPTKLKHNKKTQGKVTCQN